MSKNFRLAALAIISLGACQMYACTKNQVEQETAEEEKKEESGDNNFRTDNFAYGKLSDELLASATPGAVALLSCCMYYEDCLQKGIAAGQKWVYTNSSTYSPQSTSFDNMLRSGKWGANCAMPANWAFIDMGIMNEGQRFYGDSEGGFKHYDKIKAQLLDAVYVTSWAGSKKFKELFAEDKVKPGDVFLCKGHTFIYMGDEKFLAAGHDGKWHTDATAATEDSRHAVFDSWVCDMKSNTDYNYSIYWQMGFRSDYLPKFYRNATGKLVPYPTKGL